MIGRTNSTFGGSISLPDGSTATANDVQTWLKCAGINKSYTSVSQVVADTDTMFLLMSDENAMKYLARSTDFADTICADETSMTYLGQSAYVDSTILNSDIWCNAICDSVYFESVLCDKVPTMTSDTAPSGEAIASSIHPNGTYQKYHAFDNMHVTFLNTRWISAQNSSQSVVAGNWIGYKFENRVRINKVSILQQTDDGGYQDDKMLDTTVDLQGSNDGSTWTDIKTLELKAIDKVTNINFNICENKSYYLYYRIKFVGPNQYDTAYKVYSAIVSELQFYGRYQKR